MRFLPFLLLILVPHLALANKGVDPNCPINPPSLIEELNNIPKQIPTEPQTRPVRIQSNEAPPIGWEGKATSANDTTNIGAAQRKRKTPCKTPDCMSFNELMDHEVQNRYGHDAFQFQYDPNVVPIINNDPGQLILSQLRTRNKNLKRLDLDAGGNRQGNLNFVYVHPDHEGIAIKIYDPQAVPQEMIPFLSLRDVMGSEYLRKEGLPVVAMSADGRGISTGTRQVTRVDYKVKQNQLIRPAKEMRQAEWNKLEKAQFDQRYLDRRPSPDSAKIMDKTVEELGKDLAKHEKNFGGYFNERMKRMFGDQTLTQKDVKTEEVKEVIFDWKPDQIGWVEVTPETMKIIPSKALEKYGRKLEFASHKGEKRLYFPMIMDF